MPDKIKGKHKMNNLILQYFNNIFFEEITTTITADELIQLLFNSIENNNLITEEIKKIITLPDQLLSLFEENLKEPNKLVKISGSDIFDCFNDHTIFKTENLPDVIISKFNFNSFESIKKFIQMLTNELELTEKQIYILSLIHLKLKSANGIFTNFNNLLNANLLLFNSETFTKRTIEHELTHYLQTYCKYGLSKIKINKLLNYAKFSYLNLNESEIKFLIQTIFNKKEFIPTVDNLIDNINKIYLKYFKDNETELDFILRFKKIFNSKNRELIFNSDIFKVWQDEKYSLIPIYLYCILPDISSKNAAKINFQLLKIKF